MRFLFLVLLVNFSAFSQKIYVMGTVLDQKSGQPVDLVSVKNVRTSSATKTNNKGSFFLMSFAKDSIEFSCIGYKSMRMAFNAVVKDTTVYLKQEAVALQEVVVYGKREATMQKEIDQLLSQPTYSKKFTLQDAAGYAGVEGGSLSMSPITMLYDIFSKEGKSKRKLRYDIQQDRLAYYATFRFNRIASFSTKLTGKELEDFRDFCRFDNNYILTATDYELTFNILEAWEEYKK
jgi:hypothetical protein